MVSNPSVPSLTSSILGLVIGLISPPGVAVILSARDGTYSRPSVVLWLNELSEKFAFYSMSSRHSPSISIFLRLCKYAVNQFSGSIRRKCKRGGELSKQEVGVSFSRASGVYKIGRMPDSSSTLYRISSLSPEKKDKAFHRIPVHSFSLVRSRLRVELTLPVDINQFYVTVSGGYTHSSMTYKPGLRRPYLILNISVMSMLAMDHQSIGKLPLHLWLYGAVTRQGSCDLNVDLLT
ncbi:hypothetical protein RRG08_024590 [Elysia crispata]|uniref:Uncharacterized protein n=1 Tax=Elysia crispata TaxID=231223 RepID=A0AAE0ZW73_9GAST|nr:hypothetical protein RRG08_024590 [Elysia crispata]